ncbi:MAG TPA: hypothetical protein VKM55_25475 [Candidatus Lokiarchaeia archaeon]|nr:hypothetical protein [Candidatus Lokiarchaeia archaeon]
MTDTIIKDYYCGVCKKRHDISLPKNLAMNRESYPFAHVFLHKLESNDDLNEIDIDILTTLYIDANMSIRGVEAKPLDGTDIVSKEDFNIVVTRIMNELERWREEYTKLEKEYKRLKDENEKLKEQM